MMVVLGLQLILILLLLIPKCDCIDDEPLFWPVTVLLTWWPLLVWSYWAYSVIDYWKPLQLDGIDPIGGRIVIDTIQLLLYIIIITVLLIHWCRWLGIVDDCAECRWLMKYPDPSYYYDAIDLMMVMMDIWWPVLLMAMPGIIMLLMIGIDYLVIVID